EPATHERVHDYRIADGDVKDRRPDFADPTRVLVTEDQRKRQTHLPIRNVDIRAAQAGTADPHDHVPGTSDGRFRHVVQTRRSPLLRELNRLQLCRPALTRLNRYRQPAPG